MPLKTLIIVVATQNLGHQIARRMAREGDRRGDEIAAKLGDERRNRKRQNDESIAQDLGIVDDRSLALSQALNAGIGCVGVGREGGFLYEIDVGNGFGVVLGI